MGRKEDEATAIWPVKLSLNEAIMVAREWQQSAGLAIPAEIVTGLVGGASELLGLVREYLTIDPSKDVGRFCEVEDRLEQIAGIGTKRDLSRKRE